MNKEILRLAIPNIISNVSVPLLSTVDTALMGRLSETHIGAVGIGAMIFNFIYWNFGFLRMGTTGMTAQAFGRNDRSAIILTLGRAFLVVLALAFLVIVFQYPLGEVSFSLMNISGSQLDLVREYFQIRIWAAPATLGLYAMMGWFFGMQNATYPLILTIVINVVNIIFSYLFIQNYGMEVDGVAWGTVIAQYVGIVLAFFLFYKKYSHYVDAYQRAALLELEALKGFLQVNKDIFIRTFCLTFAFGFFYSQSSKGGEMVLAVNVILLQFLNWMSYGVDGFAYASESLVGKYHGANNVQKLKQTINLNFAWGMGLGVLFSLMYWIFGVSILRLFTDQPDVIQQTIPFLYWMIILPILSTPCYIWDGIYIGLTASKAMRDTMLIAIALYLLTFYLVPSSWGNHGLWLVLVLFLLARGVIQTFWYQWKLKV